MQVRTLFFHGLLGLTSLLNAETFVVSTLSDSGPGSLREAIAFANAGPSADRILFAENLEGAITLSSTLVVTQPLEIIGPGQDQIALDGNNAVRVLELSGAPHRIEKLTIRNGQANRGGANIRATGSLTLTECAILNGQATAIDGRNNNPNNADGGGLYHSTGTLTITSCLIEGNRTIGGFSQGGGIYTEIANATIRNSRIIGNTTNGFVAEGGGIGSRSILVIENCEISGNETLASSSGGGGVYADTTITLRQCTISGNTVGATPGTGVEGYSVGGAFANVGFGSATFENCTITGNSAPHGEGQGPGISSLSRGIISFQGCIVSGNIGEADLDETPNLEIDYRDNGFNIFGIVTNTNLNSPANQNNTSSYGVTNPRLSALDFHGAATRTHIPLPGSPALDTGDTTSTEDFDQRGSEFPRLVGTRLDIGSAERQAYLDSDSDGIPDSVEALIAGLPTSDGDLDDDGISDRIEFLILGMGALQDPNLFPKLNVSLTGNSATLTFPHSAAREYRLHSSNDLVTAFEPLSETFSQFPDQDSAFFNTSADFNRDFFSLEARIPNEPTQ